MEELVLSMEDLDFLIEDLPTTKEAAGPYRQMRRQDVVVVG